jgi:hypothetical protein
MTRRILGRSNFLWWLEGVFLGRFEESGVLGVVFLWWDRGGLW